MPICTRITPSRVTPGAYSTVTGSPRSWGVALQGVRADGTVTRRERAQMQATCTSGPGSPGRASPLSVALWCARQGWYVHPLSPGLKVPVASCFRCPSATRGQRHPDHPVHKPEDCPCIPQGRYCHGVRAATTDLALVERWWTQNPDFGVGVAAGPSNLLIVDLDMHQSTPPDPDRLLPGLALPADLDLASVRNGEDALGLLCRLRRAPQLVSDPPQTLTVRTPSGGLHLWYRVTDGSQWRPDSRGHLGWQIDIRADRSYAVAPATHTRDGSYTCVGTCRTPAPLPRWLAHDLARVGLKHRPHTHTAHRRRLAGSLPPSAGSRGYVAAAVRAELDAVASCRAGRSDQLNRSSFALGQFVGAGLLDGREVHQALTDAAELAGIDPNERKAQSTIERALEAGSRHPRRIGAPA
ncbi:bifunctional DNA primase/polymerase [Streptomyces roseolus]|uniref:bifunctional DNA primase/polymerase n=1 Tax=Streptomyces roseolus TaxID=67358 RepID=UPI00378F28B1